MCGYRSITKMALKMQPEVISREYVKPSALASHNHPTIHRLSMFDQFAPHMYVPLLFLYTSRDGKTDPTHRSSLLRSSLSAALSHYYPLAGRIKDSATVDCNDEGALFLEARIGCHLSEFLTNNDFEALGLLCPDSLSYKNSIQAGPVAVQVTYFKCGGMSIGVCLCHRIMDMESMSSFVNNWAFLARNPDNETMSPEFNIGSLYPPADLPFEKPTDSAPPNREDLVGRILVFDGSKIADLKRKVGDQIPNPTRVEAVTALLHKTAIKAAARASSPGTIKPSVAFHVMNLRPHLTPPLSNRSKGNAVVVFKVSTPENKEVELGWLAKEFRESKSRYSIASNGEETLSLDGEHQVHYFSSWCRNPFYQSDFGWGKPFWVGPTCWKLHTGALLLDTREGDGIEVHLCLDDKVMAFFEKDEQLLSFCTVSTTITP